MHRNSALAIEAMGIWNRALLTFNKFYSAYKHYNHGSKRVNFSNALNSVVFTDKRSQ